VNSTLHCTNIASLTEHHNLDNVINYYNRISICQSMLTS